MTDFGTGKTSDTEKLALDHYVHTPYESGLAAYDLAVQLYGTEGISMGNPLLDLFVPPNRPGWTRVLLARPGEFKSTLLRIIAKTEALRLKRENIADKCVVIVTYEEAVDTQALFFLPEIDMAKFWDGKVHPDKIVTATARPDQLDIFFIGESMKKNSANKPPMSVNIVMAGIAGIMKEYGKKASIILWDYIQETQVEKDTGDRKNKVISAMSDVIRMCILLGIPIDIGSQAKQTSLERTPWPIPEKGDSEYSFYPEQKGTNVVIIWKPWETHRNNPLAQSQGIKLQGWNEHLELSPKLAVIGTTKKRYGLQMQNLPVYVDPVNLTITDIPQIKQQMEAMR